MKGSDLLEQMELIDWNYVEEAEKTGKRNANTRIIWTAVAACIGVVLVGSVLLLNGSDQIQQSMLLEEAMRPASSPVEEVKEPQIKPEIQYNKPNEILSADRACPPRGYFTEPLTREQIVRVEPGKRYDYMTYSGVAGFDGEGRCINVTLLVGTTQPDVFVHVAINPWGPDYLLDGEPVYTEWNGTVYTVWEYSEEEKTILDARTELDDGEILGLMVSVNEDQLPEARRDFEQILECFTYYQQGSPSLEKIIPSEIPDWIDEELTLEEAYQEPTFGKYLPKALPEGFVEEGCYRLKNQQEDMLSGLWSRGNDTLSWQIRHASEEDQERVTDAAEKRNYDMSLYSIPLCDSVPEELWTMVNNPIFKAEELCSDMIQARTYRIWDGSTRMASFGVLYSNIVVEINAKGISPVWLCEQLQSLIEKQ